MFRLILIIFLAQVPYYEKRQLPYFCRHLSGEACHPGCTLNCICCPETRSSTGAHGGWKAEIEGQGGVHGVLVGVCAGVRGGYLVISWRMRQRGRGGSLITGTLRQHTVTPLAALLNCCAPHYLSTNITKCTTTILEYLV